MIGQAIVTIGSILTAATCAGLYTDSWLVGIGTGAALFTLMPYHPKS